MQRYTEWRESQKEYVIEREYLVLDRRYCRGEAIQRLAGFENLVEQLQEDYRQTAKLAEQLRLHGQARSVELHMLEKRLKGLGDVLNYIEIYSGVK